MEENKYNLFKDWVKFTVRSLVSIRQMKRLVNSSNKFVLMISNPKKVIQLMVLMDLILWIKMIWLKLFLTLIMRYLRKLKDFLLRGRFNMRSNWCKVFHFLTLVCTDYQSLKMNRLKNLYYNWLRRDSSVQDLYHVYHQ